LAFGDLDETTGEINDEVITNNGDSLKVLATVASTVYAFTAQYPNASIFATGSTNVRTRLYRMGLSNNLAEIAADFYIYGFTSTFGWKDFVLGEDYEAFMIKRK
jgi:ribonucleotide monophosphatase NagD (HAD superfamily)